MIFAPKFLEMAGVKHPAPIFQDREVAPIRGRSMVPWLKGKTSSIHNNEFVGSWEMNGRAGIRKGNWKDVPLCTSHQRKWTPK